MSLPRWWHHQTALSWVWSSSLRLFDLSLEVTSASGFHSDPIKPVKFSPRSLLKHTSNPSEAVVRQKPDPAFLLCWQMLQGLWIRISQLPDLTLAVLLPQPPVSWVYRLETRLSWDLFVLCLTRCRLFSYQAFSSCLTLKRNFERWVFFSWVT